MIHPIDIYISYGNFLTPMKFSEGFVGGFLRFADAQNPAGTELFSGTAIIPPAANMEPPPMRAQLPPVFLNPTAGSDPAPEIEAAVNADFSTIPIMAPPPEMEATPKRASPSAFIPAAVNVPPPEIIESPKVCLLPIPARTPPPDISPAAEASFFPSPSIKPPPRMDAVEEEPFAEDAESAPRAEMAAIPGAAFFPSEINIPLPETIGEPRASFCPAARSAPFPEMIAAPECVSKASPVAESEPPPDMTGPDMAAF